MIKNFRALRVSAVHKHGGGATCLLRDHSFRRVSGMPDPRLIGYVKTHANCDLDSRLEAQYCGVAAIEDKVLAHN